MISIDELEQKLDEKEREIKYYESLIQKRDSEAEIMKLFKLRYSEEEVIKMDPFEFDARAHFLAYVEYDVSDRSEILFGYEDAAFALIKMVICENGTVDELIYPIAFSIQHSIEIGLKLIYEKISIIKNIKYKKNLPSLNEHSIKDMDEIMRIAVSIDGRIEEAYRVISSYLEDFYFDEKEEAFRYKVTKGKQDILEKNQITRVSIDILCCKFYYLQERLNGCFFLLEELIEEYKLKSYTGNFSRYQIEKIALDLNGFIKCSKEERTRMKNNLAEKYATSKTQIDSAIEIINQNPAFSILIGNEIKICDIPDKEIEAYVELVHKRSVKIKNQCVEIKFGENAEDVIDSLQKTSNVLNEFRTQISNNTILYLKIFAEYGKGIIKYVEYFTGKISEYDNTMTERYDYDDALRKISTYLSCGYILQGLNMCGQRTLAEKLNYFLFKYEIFDRDIIPGCIDF